MAGSKRWDDLTDDERRNLTAYWDEHVVGKEIAANATSAGDLDHDYAIWLSVLEGVCQGKCGVSYLDLADYAWRDCFDNDMHPRSALVARDPRGRAGVMALFTVTGLIDLSSGRLLVSGVYEGHLESVDTHDATDPERYSRHAVTIGADTWEEAEQRAIDDPHTSDAA